MDSARMTREVPVGHRPALLGFFVSRLMAFCLLYFAPALAYVPVDSRPAPVTVRALGDGMSGERLAADPAAETLDPKHRKDRDEARQGAARAPAAAA